VAHAYLFSGPRGVGKTSLARILAKALNCDQGPTPQPCQSCNHCLEITQGNSLDVFEIDGASNRGIDEIRELKQNIQYLPASGRYKIYIIDEVHMLTKEAFNALLKTLEEPPKHVIFVLATTEAHKVPVTIVSRCQKFDFRRVSAADIASQLERIAIQENIQTDQRALMAIARESDGSVRDALSLMDQVLSYSPGRATLETVVEVLGLVDQGMVLQLLERITSGDMAAIVEIVDRVHTGGYDFKQFYKNLLEELRTLLYLQLSSRSREASEWVNEEIKQREKILSIASQHWLLAAMNQLLGVDAELRYSSYPKFVMELALFRLAHLNEFLTLDQLLAGVEKNPVAPDPTILSATQMSPHAVEKDEKQEIGQPALPEDTWHAVSCQGFVNFLKHEAALLSSILQQGELVLENGSNLDVRLPTGSSGADFLDTEQLKRLAGEYFRKPVTVRVTQDESRTEEKVPRPGRIQGEEACQLRRKALEHPLAQQISEIFSGNLVEVRPRTHPLDEKEITDDKGHGKHLEASAEAPSPDAEDAGGIGQ
jgi:DNA polymerase-3 subunit gamma/tau